MIVSNITKDKALLSERGGFFAVADDFEMYAPYIKKICPQYMTKGSGDHFFGTMRALENLWSGYSLENVMDCVSLIEKSSSLRSWLAIIICMIIHGRDDGNKLKIKNLSSEENPYLQIWKNKFISDGHDDNSENHKISNGLNVYEISNENSSSVLGCCSSRYFVIPPREVSEGNQEWKKTYFRFMDRNITISDFFSEIKDAQTKMKLILSARSVSDDCPLKIAKDIIRMFVSMKSNFPDDVPAVRFFGMSFYCTEGNDIPDKVLKNDVYTTLLDGKHCALFPFTEKMAKDMENCISCVQSIKMTVTDSYSKNAGKVITEAVKITASICYKIKFTGENSDVKYIPYVFDERHIYDTKHIKSADSMGTFCMFPNVPLEYEKRCRKYTYVSNLNYTVQGKGIPSNNEFKKADFVSIPLGGKLNVYSVEKPEHLLSVSINSTEISGYVLNLRKDGKDYEPLLINGRSVSIDFSVNERSVNNVMRAYFDFGSSSSAFGYKINNGVLNTESITGGTEIVRRLLAKYVAEGYENYMNFNTSDIAKSSVLSANVSLNGSEIKEFMPYHLGFVPFANRLTSFEKNKLQIDVSHKSDLLDGIINDNTVSIIYNMCYTALCHAIDTECKKIIFFPSFPNENFAVPYSKLWKDIINKMQDIFDIEICNVINAKNKNLLYESIAISNGTEGIGDNVLRINVDIGDSTTDMSAVLTSGKSASLCGYSSINYAGKQLLKASFCSMLSSIGMKNDIHRFREYAKKFILGNENNHENPFIIPDDENQAEIVADEICNKFYPNQKRGGKPRNESWQNNFMELIDNARINASDRKDSIHGYNGASDIKIKADIIMRYAVIMPVIKDFTETALSMCNSDEKTSISISFYGGGSKGILLADEFTGGSNSFKKRISEYFQSYFPQECYVEVPVKDAKVQLVRGLSNLDEYIDTDGEYNLRPADGDLKFVVSWKDIDPSSVLSLNDVRAEKCRKFNLVKPTCQEEVEENTRQRKNSENYMPEDVQADFCRYAQDIISEFVFDENIKEFFSSSFITDPLNDTKNSIKNTLSSDGSAFLKTYNSKVYPEMVKSTSYMFAMSEMLSAHFGNGFSGKAVTGKPDEDYIYTR